MFTELGVTVGMEAEEAAVNLYQRLTKGCPSDVGAEVKVEVSFYDRNADKRYTITSSSNHKRISTRTTGVD